MRKPIMAANWKMHKTVGEAVAFGEKLVSLLASAELAHPVDTLVAAPFTALEALGRVLARSPVALAAENVWFEEKGAFTGEISAPMLLDVGCKYVIVGHSERRALFGETSELVGRKVRAAHSHGLGTIVCVGETLEEREAGRAFDVVVEQLRGSLEGVEQARATDLVVAYEPVWAIGTGRTATPELAQEVHACIREQLGRQFGGASEQIRIQYGGSVKPELISGIMSQPDIDGALVGGASLDPDSFFAIIRYQ